MGGVPARVAVGFTKGSYDSGVRQWVVTDLDAHAWVEAWFPQYGWVPFDPTPPADPALGGHIPQVGGAIGATGAASKAANGTRAGAAALGPSSQQPGSGNGGPLGAIGVLGILALLATGAAVAVWTRPLRGADAMIAELEGALRRTGRPVSGGATLSSIERRLGPDAEAGAYVRALRLRRFAGGRELPTPRQRRALRARLAAGLGPLGWLRALWAVPPRRLGS
jgi:hypothetical protein